MEVFRYFRDEFVNYVGRRASIIKFKVLVKKTTLNPLWRLQWEINNPPFIIKRVTL